MRITALRLQAAFVIMLGATLSTMTGAFAQADARYPARPIRLIVAFRRAALPISPRACSRNR